MSIVLHRAKPSYKTQKSYIVVQIFQPPDQHQEQNEPKGEWKLLILEQFRTLGMFFKHET